MRKAEVILSILEKKATEDQTHQFDRLYRNLFNPDLYLLAYNNLYANEGNMTEGTDGKTIDGFHLALIETLIAEMRQETYQPKPVRRTHIPNKNGGKRPLGIPAFRDKLVQEVVRMLLEAIYEPGFCENSHGYRPGRSCHTALLQIKTTSKGTNWVIEGDIKGFFENIDHQKLLTLLQKRIKDGRFIQLVEKFLGAGYMQDRTQSPTLWGMPQGGIVSPILANIYLHEFDLFMQRICAEHTCMTSRDIPNKEYERLRNARRRADYAGNKTLAHNLLKQMRTIPAVDLRDPARYATKYTRYADDFAIMIKGQKERASRIREEIRAFLQDHLNLELNMEKTQITNLRENRARFLGYEIAKTIENSYITKQSTGTKTRAANGTIQLLVPEEVVREKLAPFMKNGKPVHHDARINNSVLDIITQYSAEMRGLYYYYSLAPDVSTKLGKYKFYHYTSLAKTIARKEQISVKAVIEKYGVDVKRKQGTGTRKLIGTNYQTREGTKILTYFNEPLRKQAKAQIGRTGMGLIPTVMQKRHQLLDRLHANTCELCGYESADTGEFEVHHVRKLKDIKQKYAKRGKNMPAWVLRMSSIRRKTLVVCKNCHLNIHKGLATPKRRTEA